MSDVTDSCNTSTMGNAAEIEGELVKVMVRVRPMLEEASEVKGVAETDDLTNENEPCAIVVDRQTLKLLGAEQSTMSTMISKFDANRAKERTYKFSRVFDAHCSQETVFQEVEEYVQAAVQGFNATILAHGPQSGGKTFTMTGSPDAPGVIPRAIDLIFNRLLSLTHKKKANLFVVEVSYVEWYNNSFRDLLRDPDPLSLPLRESRSSRDLDLDDPAAEPRPLSAYDAAINVRGDKIDVRESPVGVFLVGPSLRKRAKSADEVIGLVVKGDLARSFSGGAGSTSTRGHAILTIYIDTKIGPKSDNAFSRGELRLGKLNFVDLASGERLVNAFGTPSKQKQSADDKDELIKINTSLTALNDVIRTLGTNATINQRKKNPSKLDLPEDGGSFYSPSLNSPKGSAEMHVPYMNSKFTQLFRDSFGGNGKSVVIVNIPCEKCHLHLIVNALTFAVKARKVINNPMQNKLDIPAEIVINTAHEQSIIEQLKQQLLEPLMRQVPKGGKRPLLTNTPTRPKSYNFTIKNIVAKDLPYKCFPMRPCIRFEIKNVVFRTSKQIYKYNSVKFPEEFTFEIDAADYENVELEIRIMDKIPFRSRWEGKGKCRVHEFFTVMEEKPRHVERLLFDDNSLDGYAACGQLQFSGTVRSSVAALKASIFDHASYLSPKALPPVSLKARKADRPVVPEFNPNRAYVLSVKSFTTTDARVAAAERLGDAGGCKFFVEARFGNDRKRSGIVSGKTRYRGKDKVATVFLEDPDVKIKTNGAAVKSEELHLILFAKGSGASNQVIGRIIQPVDVLLTLPGDECVSKEFVSVLRDVQGGVTGKVSFAIALHSTSVLQASEDYLDESFHIQNNMNSLKASPMEFGWIRITSVEGMRMNILRLLGAHARKMRCPHHEDFSIHQDLLLVMEYGEYWVGTSQLMQDCDDCCKWNNLDFKIFGVREDLLRLPLKISIFNRRIEGKQGLIGSAAVYLHQIVGEHLSINKAEVYIRTRRGKPNGKLVLNGMLVRDNGDSWMAATVVKVRHDGNYDILYEDGEVERNVSKDLLMLAARDPRLKALSPRIVAARPRSKYPVGTRVEVLYGGRDLWYPATVVTDHGNALYDIESEYEVARTNVHQSSLRLPLNTLSSAANTPASPANTFSNTLANPLNTPNYTLLRRGHTFYNITGGPNGSPGGGATHVYSVGDKVEANFKSKGKWYPATIWKVLNTLVEGVEHLRFDIDYESGVRECGIAPDKMRPAFASKYYHTPSLYNKNRETIFDNLVSAALGATPGASGAAQGAVTGSASSGAAEEESEGAAEESNAGERSPRRRSLHHGSGSGVSGGNGSSAHALPLTRVRSHHSQSFSLSGGALDAASGAVDSEGEREGEEDEDVDDAPVFALGDRVEAPLTAPGAAQCEAQYAPGVVTEVDERGLSILFDCGESETRVDPALVRPLSLPLSETETADEDPLPFSSLSLSLSTTAHTAHAHNASTQFSLHERVEANYRGIGKWLPGRISRDRGGGVFDLLYEDGRIETKVTTECLRKRDDLDTRAAHSFPLSAEAEVNSKGLGYWYPCRVLRHCSDGRYDMVFEDGEIEAHVPEMFLRVPRRDKDVIPSGKPVFGVGDKVMVKSRSRSVEQEIKSFQDCKRKSEEDLEELFSVLRAIEMEEASHALCGKRWETALCGVRETQRDVAAFVAPCERDREKERERDKASAKNDNKHDKTEPQGEIAKLRQRAESEETAACTLHDKHRALDTARLAQQRDLQARLARVAELERRVSRVVTHIAGSSRSGLEEAEMHSLMSGTQDARQQREEIQSARRICEELLKGFAAARRVVDDAAALLGRLQRTLHALLDCAANTHNSGNSGGSGAQRQSGGGLSGESESGRNGRNSGGKAAVSGRGRGRRESLSLSHSHNGHSGNGRESPNRVKPPVLNSSGHFEDERESERETERESDALSLSLSHTVAGFGFDSIYAAPAEDEVFLATDLSLSPSPSPSLSVSTRTAERAFSLQFDAALRTALGSALLGKRVVELRRCLAANAASERVVFAPQDERETEREGETTSSKKHVSLVLPQTTPSLSQDIQQGEHKISAETTVVSLPREEVSLSRGADRGLDAFSPCALALTTLRGARVLPTLDVPPAPWRDKSAAAAPASAPPGALSGAAGEAARIAEACRSLREKKLRADLAESAYHALHEDFSRERALCEALQRSIDRFIARHSLGLVVEARGSDEIDRARAAVESERRALDSVESARLAALREAEEARNFSLERYDELRQTRRPDLSVSPSLSDGRISCSAEQFLALLDVARRALVEEWARWAEAALLAEEEKARRHALGALLRRRLKELRVLSRQTRDGVAEYAVAHRARSDAADAVNELKMKVDEKRKELNTMRDALEREAMVLQRLERKAGESGGLFRTHSFSALRRTSSFKLAPAPAPPGALSVPGGAPPANGLGALQTVRSASADELSDCGSSCANDDARSISLSLDELDGLSSASSSAPSGSGVGCATTSSGAGGAQSGGGIATDELTPRESLSGKDEHGARFPASSAKRLQHTMPPQAPQPLQRSLSMRTLSLQEMHQAGLAPPPSSPPGARGASGAALTARRTSVAVASTPRRAPSEALKEALGELPRDRAAGEGALCALQEKSEELMREVRRADNFWAKNEKEAFPAALWPSAAERESGAACPASAESLASLYALNCARSYMRKGDAARRALFSLLQEEHDALHRVLSLCEREKATYERFSTHMVRDSEELQRLRGDIEVEVAHETSRKKLQQERLQLLALKDQVARLEDELLAQEKTLVVASLGSAGGSAGAAGDGKGASSRRFVDPNHAAVAEEQAKRMDCTEQVKKFRALCEASEKMIHDEAIQRIGKEFHAIQPAENKTLFEIDHAQLQDVMALYANESHDISDAIRYSKEQLKALEAAVQHVRREQDLLQFGKLDHARSDFERVSSRWRKLCALLEDEVREADALLGAYRDKERAVHAAFRESRAQMTRLQRALQSLPSGGEYLLSEDFSHKRRAFVAVMNKIVRLRKSRQSSEPAGAVQAAVAQRVESHAALRETRGEVEDALQAAETQFREYNATADGYADTVNALSVARDRVARDLESYEATLRAVRGERERLQSECRSLEDEAQYLSAAALYLDDVKARVRTEQARAGCATGLGRVLAMERAFSPNSESESDKLSARRRRWKERLQRTTLRPVYRLAKQHVAAPSAKTNRFLLAHAADSGALPAKVEIQLVECDPAELFDPSKLPSVRQLLPCPASTSYAPVFMVSRAKMQNVVVSVSPNPKGAAAVMKSPLSSSTGGAGLPPKGQTHAAGSADSSEVGVAHLHRLRPKVSFHESLSMSMRSHDFTRSHSLFSMSDGDADLADVSTEDDDVEIAEQQHPLVEPHVEALKAIEREAEGLLAYLDEKWFVDDDEETEKDSLVFSSQELDSMLARIKVAATAKPVSLPEDHEEQLRREIKALLLV